MVQVGRKTYKSDHEGVWAIPEFPEAKFPQKTPEMNDLDRDLDNKKNPNEKYCRSVMQC